jgi:hypothetical protein
MRSRKSNRDLLFVSVSHRRLSWNLPAANAGGLGPFNLPAPRRRRVGDGGRFVTHDFRAEAQNLVDTKSVVHRNRPLRLAGDFVQLTFWPQISVELKEMPPYP